MLLVNSFNTTHPNTVANDSDDVHAKRFARQRQRGFVGLYKGGDLIAEPQQNLAKRFRWRIRLLLGAIAFGGSIIYALSFRAISDDPALLGAALKISIAAGAAWISFGLILLIVNRVLGWRNRGITALHWADACLAAMGVGIAIKMAAVLFNVALLKLLQQSIADAPVTYIRAWIFFDAIHLFVLLIADIAMAAVFARRMAKLGARVRATVALWVLGLNGLFVMKLWWLIHATN